MYCEFVSFLSELYPYNKKNKRTIKDVYLKLLLQSFSILSPGHRSANGIGVVMVAHHDLVCVALWLKGPDSAGPLKYAGKEVANWDH